MMNLHDDVISILGRASGSAQVCKSPLAPLFERGELNRDPFRPPEVWRVKKGVTEFHLLGGEINTRSSETVS
jgi:hypothetical protein